MADSVENWYPELMRERGVNLTHHPTHRSYLQHHHEHAMLQMLVYLHHWIKYKEFNIKLSKKSVL